MKSSKKSLLTASDMRISWNAVLNTLILLLAFFVLLPQLDLFNTSLDVLQAASIEEVVLAFGLGISTLLFAASTYWILLGRRLSYGRTLLVQIAGTFTNRLLPAGLGGLSLNVRYLMKSHFTAGRAASIAATNNILGFVGHFLLILGFLVSGKLTMSDISIVIPSSKLLLLVLGIGCIVAAIVWWRKDWRNKIRVAVRDSRRQFFLYRREPGVLFMGLMSCFMVSLLYIACFYVCIGAVGLDISLVQAFVVFTIGIAAGAVSPTPGGLIGVEAGMLAGLISYQLPEAASLSVVLLYRLITYWVPIVPGFLMFKYIQYKKIV